MFGQRFNLSGREKCSDILRVYRGAFDEASGSQNPDVKIRAFNQVVDFCASSDCCQTDNSIKRNKVMYWTYNGLGDAWVAKTRQNPSKRTNALRRAIGWYRDAVNVARDAAEKIDSLQRIAAVYKQIEDGENLNKTRESIVHSLSDEYKRLGYMQLAQNNLKNPKITEWLEKALAYVTKEEVSFLGKCQNTLSICKMLAESYKEAGDKVNARRITKLMHKTALLTIQAMEDKAGTEKKRTRQLEWYGKMLETVFVYGKGDRGLKKQTAGCLAGLLEENESVMADGILYGREALKKMLSS